MSDIVWDGEKVGLERVKAQVLQRERDVILRRDHGQLEGEAEYVYGPFCLVSLWSAKAGGRRGGDQF